MLLNRLLLDRVDEESKRYTRSTEESNELNFSLMQDSPVGEGFASNFFFSKVRTGS